MYGIFTFRHFPFQFGHFLPNVGKYTSPMDPMGNPFFKGQLSYPIGLLMVLFLPPTHGFHWKSGMSSIILLCLWLVISPPLLNF